MKFHHAKRLVTACLFGLVMLASGGQSYGQTCLGFGVSPAGPFQFGNSGGSNQFFVTTGQKQTPSGVQTCTAGLGTVSGFIRANTAPNGIGSIIVDFTVSANPDLATRSGIITVVSEDGRSLSPGVNQDAASGGFSLSAPSSQTLLNGSTASFIVSINRSGGFSGAVSLSASSLPSGVTASFSPNPTTTNSSTVTLTSNGSTPAACSSVVIRGVNGNSTQTVNVTLCVTDFSISLNPASLTVVQGGPGVQGQVIINSINGFSGSVALGPVNVPSGVAFSFSPNPATTSSTMTVTANAFGATGAFSPTIAGTSAGQVRPVGLASNLTLTVSGFTVSACDHLIVQPGGSGSCLITIHPAGGYSGPIQLSASGLPSGTSATFNPNPATPPSYTSTMTVTAAASAAPGTSTLLVTGIDGNGVLQRTSVVLIVGTPPVASRYVPVTPCRVADTRNPNGPFGGPFLTGGVTREFDIPNSACGIPSTALSYVLNATVVPRGPLGFLTLLPCGQPQPLASNLNSIDGRVKAVAAIIPAGTNGGVCAFPSDATDLVLDISGYFVAASNPSALAFYPITPCRIADTRNPPGPFGGPSLSGGVARNFPILSSSCNVPSTAQAYSLNFTVVPAGFLGFFTAWPAGQTQPLASTLNAPTGTVVANAAIVQAGTNGDLSVFATNNSDLVIDINGYFAPPGAGGLSLIAVTPCRVLDTRNSAGSAPELDPQGPAEFPPINGTLAVNITASNCGAPASAQAYVLNATVVPSGPLGYITLWPNGTPQPLVSTLNAIDGAVTSNMAIVITNNGSVNVFTSDPTHLVLDIFGYFAP